MVRYTTPLEFMALLFSWPPLEVGVGYRNSASACLSLTGVGCGNTLWASSGKDSTVRQFANIFQMKWEDYAKVREHGLLV